MHVQHTHTTYNTYNIHTTHATQHKYMYNSLTTHATHKHMYNTLIQHTTLIHHTQYMQLIYDIHIHTYNTQHSYNVQSMQLTNTCTTH